MLELWLGDINSFSKDILFILYENIVESKIVVSTILLLSLWKINVLSKDTLLNSHSFLLLGYVPFGQVS